MTKTQRAKLIEAERARRLERRRAVVRECVRRYRDRQKVAAAAQAEARSYETIDP